MATPFDASNAPSATAGAPVVKVFAEAVKEIVVNKGLKVDFEDSLPRIHGIALKGPKLIAAE